MDVREKLAQLNPSSVRYDVCPSGAGSTENPYAMALGFVPAGMGRDLLEYLYWPDGAILRGAAIYQGVVRVAMKEWATRMQAHTDARCTYGLAETLAKYAKDRSPATVRNLAILQARVAVARDNLWPERLEDKLPMLVPMLLRAMKGEKHSNVDRARAMGINESSYRERWSKVYEWMLTKMIDEEQAAARAMEQALRNEAA
ncbi:hypothetical protein AB9H29_12080 [Stenotrophomonas sepilia]|uniref:hypothetical protein n=1 Tax=Stenotrophomonas sepilia TaxID=2860290 RepID=UPI0035589FFD